MHHMRWLFIPRPWWVLRKALQTLQLTWKGNKRAPGVAHGASKHDHMRMPLLRGTPAAGELGVAPGGGMNAWWAHVGCSRATRKNQEEGALPAKARAISLMCLPFLIAFAGPVLKRLVIQLRAPVRRADAAHGDRPLGAEEARRRARRTHAVGVGGGPPI